MGRAITAKTLRRYNVAAGLVHLAQGIVVLALSRAFELPITGNFLQFNPASRGLEPASTVLFHLSLPLLVALFFFLSAVAHLSVATFYWHRYATLLAHGINKVRWIEYSLSASIMMVAVGLLVGIYDLSSLVMMFALVAIMNLMGLVMEVHNQTTTKTNWLSYWVGCLAGVAPWAVVAFYVWLGAHEGSPAPTFVYWIFGSIFVFFNCFAVNMALQYKKVGPWKNYIYGEFVYMILSLAAKSLLAWQIFAGTLRP
jgi:Heliorhodopsin